MPVLSVVQQVAMGVVKAHEAIKQHKEHIAILSNTIADELRQLRVEMDRAARADQTIMSTVNVLLPDGRVFMYDAETDKFDVIEVVTSLEAKEPQKGQD